MYFFKIKDIYFFGVRVKVALRRGVSMVTKKINVLKIFNYDFKLNL